MTTTATPQQPPLLRKPRPPGDVHDVWNVEVGKPYRGQYVEKIDVEAFDLENDRVKVRRLIHLDNEIIIIEDTWHDHDEVYADGVLLPYDEISFPSMDPADFVAPDKKKKDREEEEKKKKRELLRKKAKEMLGNNKKKDDDPPPPPPKDEKLKLKVKTPDGRLLPVVVEPTDTVEDLKEKIEDEHGVPSEDQDLSRKGEPLEDPDATMEDLGVKDGDVIDLLAPPPPPATKTMSVKVRTPEGNVLRLSSVSPTDTVRDIKDKIEDEHGIPSEDQNLSHQGGEPLEDPDATMEDLGVSDGDFLDLLPSDDDDDGGMTIDVRKPDGTILSPPLAVEPDDTVEDVKKKIESEHGIPAKEQNLSYSGTPLDDDDDVDPATTTLDDLGVSDGDTLDLLPKKEKPPPPKAKPAKKKTTKKAKKPPTRVRKLNPDSAWVYPTKESAPSDGEEDNLQGIWSVAPTSGGTEPVEVNIHPMRKEPKSAGNTVHGAYGYVNGAKPDENGVVNPSDVVFYPPGETSYRPDFDHVGWWSSPESSSKTTVKWWFEGDDMVHHRVHTVKVCGHEMVFESRYTK